MTRFSFQSFVVPLMLLAVVVLPGCKPSVAEKSKPAAEKSLVGQEVVFKDASGAEVHFAGGKNAVTMPLGFPADVPLYPKAMPVQTVVKAPSVYIMLNASDVAANVKAFYEKKLEENGWKVKTMTAKTDTLLNAGKEGRKLVVLISDKPEGTQFSLALEGPKP